MGDTGVTSLVWGRERWGKSHPSQPQGGL